MFSSLLVFPVTISDIYQSFQSEKSLRIFELSFTEPLFLVGLRMISSTKIAKENYEVLNYNVDCGNKTYFSASSHCHA